VATIIRKKRFRPVAFYLTFITLSQMGLFRLIGTRRIDSLARRISFGQTVRRLSVSSARARHRAIAAGLALQVWPQACSPPSPIASSIAFSPDLYVYQFDCLPDGGFIGTAAPGDGDNNWWVAKLYTFSDGQAHVIFTPPDVRHQIADPRVSPDGRQVAFISGIMSDFGFNGGDVYTMAVSGGTATDITPGLQASATAIGWSCDGRLLASLLAGDQTQIVAVGAPGTQKRPWSGTESLKGADSGLRFGCPSPVTAFVHESFTTAPQIEIGPIGGWHDLTHVNTGMTMPLESQSVTWKSDGHIGRHRRG
jgi:hypothetical protein